MERDREYKKLSLIPEFDDLVLVPLTHEEIRIIKAHACPDEEFLVSLQKASPTADGLLVGCRRECVVDINCVLTAVSEELTDEDELKKLIETYEKLEPYEFG